MKTTVCQVQTQSMSWNFQCKQSLAQLTAEVRDYKGYWARIQSSYSWTLGAPTTLWVINWLRLWNFHQEKCPWPRSVWLVGDSCTIQHLYLKFKSHICYENDEISLKPLPFETNYYRVMRFNPGNAHTWGLLIHGVYVGSDELDGDQTTQGNTGFTQVWPPCWAMTYVLLVWLYCWGDYNGGVYSEGIDWI
jgi:hypothetical protein